MKNETKTKTVKLRNGKGEEVFIQNQSSGKSQYGENYTSPRVSNAAPPPPNPGKTVVLMLNQELNPNNSPS